MAAVPFGFSFGDFVAAIEVIHKAAQALKRSSGAQSNFNQAVADLETFETVLNQVVALSSTTSTPQNFEAIRLCAFQCHPPLAHFLQRIRAYETRLSYLPKSKTHLLDGITGTFWKIKWAVKVEEEVAKLKAAVGPQLVAIGVLLQVKDLEQNAAACQDITQLLRLTQNVTSGIDSIWLAAQDQALAIGRLDTQTLEIRGETRTILQELPQLATSHQLGNAVVSIEDISAKMDSTSTKDQADELRSLLQTSSTALAENHASSMAVSERHEAQTMQMARTLQDVHNILAAMRISDHSNSHHTTMPSLGRSPLMPPSSTALPGEPSTWRGQSQMAASGLQHLLSTICSLLASAVMALLLMLPNIQSQLRTFMTLLESPSVLLSNSIMVTDALNRTKLLPYEYFCNWTLVQPWLESAFKDLPGESRVRCGDFEMFVSRRDRTTHVLRGEDWKRSVFPGDRVVMSMSSTRTSWNKCTRCGHVMPTQVITRDWIECTECGRLQTQMQPVPSQSTSNGYVRQAKLAPMAIVPPEHQLQQEKELNEDDKFTRVHMYMYRRTALAWAAMGGHARTVQKLMRIDGIDVNCVDEHGQTPLDLAAEHGHEAIVELLLNFRVNNELGERVNRDGETLLSSAGPRVAAEVVELLSKPHFKREITIMMQ